MAAGAGGRSAWGGESGHRATGEVGGRGAGEAGSEGWIGESGGSDATSDVGTEEDDREHVPLTTLPWGTQEIGARGLRGDARAGGSDGRK